MTWQILYNPKAGNGRGKEGAEKLKDILHNGELTFTDMTDITDTAAFQRSLGADDKLVICGGDGTLNRFINDFDLSCISTRYTTTPPEAATIFCVISPVRRLTPRYS